MVIVLLNGLQEGRLIVVAGSLSSGCGWLRLSNEANVTCGSGHLPVVNDLATEGKITRLRVLGVVKGRAVALD